MGEQLSFIVEDDLLKITDKEVALSQPKEEDYVSLPDPFVEANRKMFAIDYGEQMEIEFLNIPKIEVEETMNLKEIAKKLEQCRKYTLLIIDDLTGFPTSIHLTMKNASVEPYAQYPEALYLDYRAKRHRSDSQLIFLPDKSFVVWEGHIDVDTKKWGQPSISSSSVITRRGRYGPNDKRFLVDGVESVGNQPIIDYRPANAIA